MPEGRKLGLECWNTVMYTGLLLLTVFRLICSELFHFHVVCYSETMRLYLQCRWGRFEILDRALVIIAFVFFELSTSLL